ncbi:MAG: AraC family transcriptional regulator [Syntrophomonas sp.]
MDRFSKLENFNLPKAPVDQFKIYSNQSFTIINTSYVETGECKCSQYHFLIPIKNMPVIKMDSKVYKLKPNSIFPCNPDQSHSIVSDGGQGFKSFVLYMDKTFLESVSYSMFGSELIEFQNSYFELDTEIKNLINSFVQEASAQQPGAELNLQSLGIQAAVALLRSGKHTGSYEMINVEEHQGNISIKKSIEYMMENYDKNITLDELAYESNYSQYHFLRLFKTGTGMTPFEYLLQIRIEKAKSLLRCTRLSINQISDFCGFSSSSHFAQVFKRKVKVSPSRYRQNFI